MQSCPEMGTKRAQPPEGRAGSHWVTGLQLLGEEQLSLSGTEPFYLFTGRFDVMKGRAHSSSTVPEASLAVVVVLFSAVVLIWLWALC